MQLIYLPKLIWCIQRDKAIKLHSDGKIKMSLNVNESTVSATEISFNLNALQLLLC